MYGISEAPSSPNSSIPRDGYHRVRCRRSGVGLDIDLFGGGFLGRGIVIASTLAVSVSVGFISGGLDAGRTTVGSWRLACV